MVCIRLVSNAGHKMVPHVSLGAISEPEVLKYCWVHSQTRQNTRIFNSRAKAKVVYYFNLLKSKHLKYWKMKLTSCQRTLSVILPPWCLGWVRSIWSSGRKSRCGFLWLWSRWCWSWRWSRDSYRSWRLRSCYSINLLQNKNNLKSYENMRK